MFMQHVFYGWLVGIMVGTKVGIKGGAMQCKL